MRRPIGTWGWATVAFGVLLLATAVASVALMGVNRDTYHDWINFDPQGNEQQWDALRMSAALMYTSGHAVGQLCAALFGVVLGATTASRERRLSLAVAVAGGIGLAVVDLALAPSIATREVGKLWMVDELTRHGFSFDPNLLHDRGVLALLVAGLVAFPLWAVLGLAASLVVRPLRAAAFALVWYPVCLVGGFLTAGVPALGLPMYSNPGMAQLMLRWPVTALAATLVLSLWAVGIMRVARVSEVAAAPPATTHDSRS